MRRLLTLIAVLLFAGIFSPGESQAAEPTCSDAVLADWFDDGRIDRVYPLRCYEDAIAGLPPDLRDYTNASDVIGRALTSAVRGEADAPAGEDPTEAQATANAIETSSASTFPLPLPLILLFGIALTMLAAGAISSLPRLRRGR
ncbi:MAG: hypothetical protein M3377_06920 [Actinomycetota bacterium]|nr:hypothetical protein [Actinomycetota bacterium]